MSAVNKDLTSLAKQAIGDALKHGAKEAAASASQSRFIELRQRDGKLERIRESSSSSLAVDVYVDGRFSSHVTSDLRPAALARFVDEAVTMTRLLGEDPHRHLADPSLYEGRSQDNLGIFDEGYDAVDTDRRTEIVAQVERAAKARKGPIISVSAGYSDTLTQWVQVHSNGLEDGDRSTQYWTGATVTVDDEGERKPEDWHWVGARHLQDLGDPAKIGQEAARRALARLGQVQLPSGAMKIVVENRAAGGLLRHFVGPLTGSALQQNRSFLKDRVGEQVGSAQFTLIDDPLIRGGFGSRRFDGDGVTARPRALVKDGTLQGYLVDVYYGSKLKMKVTGGGTSNLCVAPGGRNQDAIVAEIDKGILLTGMLGGNSDPTTGDFSHGILGFEIRDGKLGRPIGEMNVTGSHRELWMALSEVGNDPYLYSAKRVPTLVFDDVSVSGT